MRIISRQLALDALAAVGAELTLAGHTESIQVLLCGSVAGMLNDQLDGRRLTVDCDVIASEPQERFAQLEAAAAVVGDRLGLKPQWLNRESSMFAYLLPPGWKARQKLIERFDPLEVWIVSRRDLLALKLMGGAKRPQDLEDLDTMKPTAEEKRFLAAYLDQMKSESLDGATFEVQRELLRDL